MEISSYLLYSCAIFVLGGVLTATTPDVSRLSKDCFYGGKKIENDKRFTLDSSGPCVIYQCRNRAAVPVDLKCGYSGKCFDVGYNLTSTSCIVQQCRQSKLSIGFDIIQEGCSSFSNGCIDVGNSYTDGCITYTCKKTKNQYSLDITKFGCKHGNRCINEDEYVNYQCQEQQCTIRNNTIGLHTVKDGCPFVNGTCLTLGELAVNKCRLYTCTIAVVNGAIFYSAKQKSAMCEDKYGGCHANGHIIEVPLQDGSKVNCTCVVDGAKVGYNCN